MFVLFINKNLGLKNRRATKEYKTNKNTRVIPGKKKLQKYIINYFPQIGNEKGEGERIGER